MRLTTVAALVLGILGLSNAPIASAADLSKEDIEKVQKSLNDKGFHPGKVDGVLGHRTRAGIREYQKSEKLPVTGRLDAETAGKLGVGPESIGGRFKGAGREVAEGSKEAAHEVTAGKPLAAGKEFGKGIGRAGEDVGKGVRKAVSLDSDRGAREKKPKQ
ncbi:MAG: peptidoglycan-binding domain-containing protein [Acidobacteria bacterium]|nr:peptidoglycan-binding domain-containing protein [Acidobacteriota bacterium]